MDCLTKTLDHMYEFLDSGDGRSNWICKMCGKFKIEYEDATP